MAKKAGPAILIVDDDKRVLKSLKMWFSNEGFSPLTVSSGNDAVETLVANMIDVAIVDFRIGKEDGITVAQRLKEIDEDLKVIILTGFPTYETAVQAMKIGAFDYLSKSSTNEKLIAVVKNAMAERKQDRIIKKKDNTGDDRMKMILYCNHSLIKERLENFSHTNPDFKMIKSFSSVSMFGIKEMSQEIHIALVCAGCNLRRIKEAYTLLPELYRAFPGIRILIINENFSDSEKVDMLKLGVRGFVSQDSSSDTLEKALNHIASGDIWVSRSVTQLSLKNMVSYDSKTTKKIRETFGLTAREVDILRQVTQGLKNREIAKQLDISDTTVKTHVNRIFKKMGVDSRSKAILMAIENKVV
jgi:two-component system, NarL family, nitrate/nitrite response regulator NarL